MVNQAMNKAARDANRNIVQLRSILYANPSSQLLIANQANGIAITTAISISFVKLLDNK